MLSLCLFWTTLLSFRAAVSVASGLSPTASMETVLPTPALQSPTVPMETVLPSTSLQSPTVPMETVLPSTTLIQPSTVPVETTLPNSPTVPVETLPSTTETQSLPRCGPVPDHLSLCGDLIGRGTNSSYPITPQIATDVTNAILETAFFIFRSRRLQDPRCIDHLDYLTCIVVTPPCDQQTGLPITICKDSCNLFKEIIASGLCTEIEEELIEVASMFRSRDLAFISGEVYPNFDCANPDTYFLMNVTESDPSSCTELFSPDGKARFLADDSTEEEPTSDTTSARKETKVTLLAVLLPVLFIVLGSLLAISALCTCFFLARKFKRKGAHSTSQSEESAELAERNTGGGTSEAFGSDTDSSSESNSITQKCKRVFGKLILPYSALEIGESIGQGSFGKVFRGRYSSESEESTQDVAIKILKNVASTSDLEDFFSESIIMKSFQHPNVLGLVGVVFDTPDDTPYLVLPFMENGNLKEYLQSKRKAAAATDTLPEGMRLADLTKMCVDIAQGMEYLVGKLFVHRDLAARNCMVGVDHHIKVGDFGLARDVYESEYYRLKESKSVRLPVKWMALETFNDGISNEKTDVWSYGVTCWEVFSLGRTPYPTVPNSDIFTFISGGRKLDRPSLCPEEMFSLLESCWSHRPEDRPSFAQIAAFLVDYWDRKHAYIIL